MTHTMRVMLEIGPKGKKVVAVAPDWPGLARGAKNRGGRGRTTARLRAPLCAGGEAGRDGSRVYGPHQVDVVERYAGTGSTDFWGISFGFSSFDHQPMSDEALEHRPGADASQSGRFSTRCEAACRRRCRRVRAAADGIGTRSSATRLPRVGLDEEAWSARRPGPLLTDEGLDAHRDAYCDAIQDFMHRASWPASGRCGT